MVIIPYFEKFYKSIIEMSKIFKNVENTAKKGLRFSVFWCTIEIEWEWIGAKGSKMASNCSDRGETGTCYNIAARLH